MLAAESCFDDPAITALDLSFNHNFGNQGLTHLGHGLEKHSAHLTKLILRNVGLDLANASVAGAYGEDLEDEDAELPPCLNPFTALLNCDYARHYVDFGRNNFANRLCTLVLCENPALGDNGVQLLCHALLASGVHTLRVLDLAETGMTEVGVSFLATMLLQPPEDEEDRMYHVSNSLEELDLSRNPLTCVGVANLCTMGLMFNSCLTSLYLVQVEIKM